ncbi:hypothetical protein yc1106_05170 [Curvularia clavata]|uniref:Uncharacterized protein n=1 Tax=Curvularia clavata TaxID=95742 RepID=A0A9Q8Z8W5_CURCL|nr:hypothetical protein yc1106_05170 [Curvularia clavata]
MATSSQSVDITSMKRLMELSPIVRNEAYFYAFEASLMLINSFLWNMRHPGPYLPADPHVYLTQDGTEVNGAVDESESQSLMFKMANTLLFGFLSRSGKHHTYCQTQELHQNHNGNESTVFELQAYSNAK